MLLCHIWVKSHSFHFQFPGSLSCSVKVCVPSRALHLALLPVVPGPPGDEGPPTVLLRLLPGHPTPRRDGGHSACGCLDPSSPENTFPLWQWPIHCVPGVPCRWGAWITGEVLSLTSDSAASGPQRVLQFPPSSSSWRLCLLSVLVPTAEGLCLSPAPLH